MSNPHPNMEALKKHSFAVIDKKKHKEISSKGGKVSGERSSERKTLKEIFCSMLDEDITTKDNKKINAKQGMALAQLRKAINGDLEAAKFITNIIGEEPKQQLNLTSDNSVNIQITPVKADENNRS